MTAAVQPASRDIALELHELLGHIDPAQTTSDALAEAARRLGVLRDRMTALRPRLEGVGPARAVGAALQRMVDVLDEHLPAVQVPRPSRAAWRRLRARLRAAYGELSRSLAAWDIHVPSLRPTNYARNLLHGGSALLAAFVLWWWPSRTLLFAIIVPWLIWAWAMEIGRRRWTWLNDRLMAALGPVAHPHEWHRVNSATWYVTALFLLTWLDWLTAAMVALVVLGLGDPTAALIGRRFGRTKLINGRSLEGSLAFVVAGGLPAGLALGLAHPEIPSGIVVGTAAAGAVAGAIAELVSRRIDDNLSIPLAAAAAAAAVLSLAGFAP